MFVQILSSFKSCDLIPHSYFRLLHYHLKSNIHFIDTDITLVNIPLPHKFYLLQNSKKRIKSVVLRDSRGGSISFGHGSIFRDGTYQSNAPPVFSWQTYGKWMHSWSWPFVALYITSKVCILRFNLFTALKCIFFPPSNILSDELSKISLHA